MRAERRELERVDECVYVVWVWLILGVYKDVLRLEFGVLSLVVGFKVDRFLLWVRCVELWGYFYRFVVLSGEMWCVVGYFLFLFFCLAVFYSVLGFLF